MSRKALWVQGRFFSESNPEPSVLDAPRLNLSLLVVLHESDVKVLSAQNALRLYPICRVFLPELQLPKSSISLASRLILRRQISCMRSKILNARRLILKPKAFCMWFLFFSKPNLVRLQWFQIIYWKYDWVRFGGWRWRFQVLGTRLN